jgi:hypothetical protein
MLFSTFPPTAILAGRKSGKSASHKDHLMKLTKAFLITSYLAISACSNYRVVLNDNVLYSPNGASPQPGLLADANFQGCLNQYFSTSGNSDAKEVTLLACPSAGIQSLAGISALINLEQLELSDNAVSDLTPLLNLKKLRVLSLRNNRVSNINALMSLPILRFIALQGNNLISCKQLEEMEKKIGNSLNRPSQCKN